MAWLCADPSLTHAGSSIQDNGCMQETDQHIPHTHTHTHRHNIHKWVKTWHIMKEGSPINGKYILKVWSWWGAQQEEKLGVCWSMKRGAYSRAASMYHIARRWGAPRKENYFLSCCLLAYLPRTYRPWLSQTVLPLPTHQLSNKFKIAWT